MLRPCLPWSPSPQRAGPELRSPSSSPTTSAPSPPCSPSSPTATPARASGCPTCARRGAGWIHVLVLAEWPQPERERDGEALLRSLGVSREAWPMLLRDEDDTRFAVVLHRGKPVALLNLFFRELPQGSGGAEEQEVRAWEDEALRKLEALLSRLSLPPEAGRPAPPP